VLYLSEPDKDAAAVSVDLDDGRMLDPTDGRVHPDPAAPVFAGDREVTTLTVWVAHRSGHATSRMPLQLFRVESR